MTRIGESSAGLRPHVFARVEPAVRERIRDEAAVLFDGNESMLVRRAITRFLNDLDEQRRRAAASGIEILVGERELVAS